MTKLKKALLLTLIFILSLSTFAFATSEIEPRTTEGQENTVSDTDVMPINVTEEEVVTPEIVEHDVYLLMMRSFLMILLMETHFYSVLK